jgi:soluble lytic murein transglycosylase-like protein
MRLLHRSVVLGLAIALIGAGQASGRVAHTVQPGETLWSIAAANNFTTRSVAASNGLGESSHVFAGQTIYVPSVPEAAAALGGGSQTSGAAAPSPLGAYSVRPGDTLSGIAARSGVTTAQVGWMNGLSPTAHVVAGTVLKLPTGAAPVRAQPVATAPTRTIVPHAAPYATPGRVDAAQIGSVAATNGVPPSLAAAVAWQESGFNNSVVSPANARGVMQMLPGTWRWVQNNLASGQLDPNSPIGNVHAGVLYLRQLLRDAGGDPATAIASYYQGASSVRRIGMLPETRRYVQNVTALRGRFGGP